MGSVVRKLEFHYDAFDQVRSSAEVREELLQRGSAIAAAAGDGFETVVVPGRSRVRVLVVPRTPAAHRAAADHALETALAAGR